MGRPKGARAKGPRFELMVTGLEGLPREIPEWEVELVAQRLRVIADAPATHASEGAIDAAE